MNYGDMIASLTAEGQPFAIETIMLNGIPQRRYTNSKPNLRAVLEEVPKSPQIAIVYQDEIYSYQDLHFEADRIAAALTAYGIGKGDRVAVCARNMPEYFFLFWGCQKIGAVLVALNAWWVGEEIAAALVDCEPKIAFLDERSATRLSGAHATIHYPVICLRTQSLALDSAELWSDFISNQAAQTPVPDLSGSDPATMLYTSGTTGAPKAAIHSHDNHTSNMMSMYFFGALAAAMRGQGAAPAAPPPPSILISMPLFHIGGLAMVYVGGSIGAKLVLSHKWDLPEISALIDRESITSLNLSPTMLKQLLDAQDARGKVFSSLQSLAVGAAPVSSSLATRTGTSLPEVSPTIGYGLTETGAISANSKPSYDVKPDSVGLPFPIVDLRICDEAGLPLGPGEIGEIWVRGPNVISSYWRREDQHSKSFPGDGWFRTGDLGELDADGFLYIRDRLKDVIIRGGENIYCAEVEAVFQSNDAVEDMTLIGLPDEEMGERAIAIVVPVSPAHADTEKLLAYAKERLAYFKVPSEIIFRDEPLPRNASQKVEKNRLRADLLEALGAD